MFGVSSADGDGSGDCRSLEADDANQFCTFAARRSCPQVLHKGLYDHDEEQEGGVCFGWGWLVTSGYNSGPVSQRKTPGKVPIEYRPLICESIDANTGDVSTISKGHGPQ